MTSIWGILFLLLWTNIVPSLALAQDPLALQANTPFALRFTAPPGLHDWAIKIRFLDSTTGHYSGETWNGTDWLGPSASWQKFQSFAANANGIVTGGIETVASTMTLQIVARDVVTESEQIIFSQPVMPMASQQFVRLSAPDAGYFSLIENGVERLVPKIADDPVVMTQSDQLSVGFVNRDGVTTIPPQPYRLDGPGLHAISFKPPPPAYTMSIVGPTIVRPNQPTTWHIVTSPAYTGQILWYLNGEKMTANPDSSLTHQFPLAGAATLNAVLADTDQIATTTLAVQSYSSIAITRILPNPAGSDATKEKITLANHNPYAVSLTNWQLKPRTGTTIIPISTAIEANSEITITPEKRLVNQASQYDLINESGQIVDTIWYSQPKTDEVLIRQGLDWISESIPSNTTVTQDISLSGVIKTIHGRALDLETNQRLIHVVITKPKQGTVPHLHKGDSITVTGIWHTLRGRNYVRVEATDLKIIKAVVPIKKAAKKIKATPKPHTVKFSVDFPPIVTERKKPLSPLANISQAWTVPSAPPRMLAVLVTIGILLLLPSSRSRADVA